MALSTLDLERVANRQSDWPDLSAVRFAKPAGLVGYCCLHRRLALETGIVAAPTRGDTNRYMSRMRLPKQLELCGLSPSEFEFVHEHKPRNRLVPLTSIESEEAIDEIVNMLISRIDLEGQSADEAYDAMQELALNVTEHSRSDGLVAAQNYGNNRNIELAVGDWGLGIRATLEASGEDFASDADAIYEAVSTRLSSKESYGGAGLGTVLGVAGAFSRRVLTTFS